MPVHRKIVGRPTERIRVSVFTGGRLIIPNLPPQAEAARKAGKPFYVTNAVNLGIVRDVGVEVVLPTYHLGSGKPAGKRWVLMTVPENWRTMPVTAQRKYLDQNLTVFDNALTGKGLTVYRPTVEKLKKEYVNEAKKQINKAIKIREYTVAIPVYKNGRQQGYSVMPVRMMPGTVTSTKKLDTLMDSLKGTLAKINEAIGRDKTLVPPGKDIIDVLGRVKAQLLTMIFRIPSRIRKKVEAEFLAGKNIYIAKRMPVSADGSALMLKVPTYNLTTGRKAGSLIMRITLPKTWSGMSDAEQRRYIRKELIKQNSLMISSGNGLVPANKEIGAAQITGAMKQIKKGTEVREYAVAIPVYKRGVLSGRVFTTLEIPANIAKNKDALRKHLKKHFARINRRLKGLGKTIGPLKGRSLPGDVVFSQIRASRLAGLRPALRRTAR